MLGTELGSSESSLKQQALLTAEPYFNLWYFHLTSMAGLLLDSFIWTPADSGAFVTYNYAVGSCLPLCLSRRVQLSLALKREFSDSSLRQIIIVIFMVFLLTYKTRCNYKQQLFFPLFFFWSEEEKLWKWLRIILKIDNIIDLNINLSLKAHYENPRIKWELQREQRRTSLYPVLPAPLISFCIRDWF